MQNFTSEILKKYIRRRITYKEALDALLKEEWDKSDAEMYLRGVNDVLSLDKKLVILMLTEWEVVCSTLDRCTSHMTFEQKDYDRGQIHEILGKIQQQVAE